MITRLICIRNEIPCVNFLTSQSKWGLAFWACELRFQHYWIWGQNKRFGFEICSKNHLKVSSMAKKTKSFSLNFGIFLSGLDITTQTVATAIRWQPINRMLLPLIDRFLSPEKWPYGCLLWFQKKRQVFRNKTGSKHFQKIIYQH